LPSLASVAIVQGGIELGKFSNSFHILQVVSLAPGALTGRRRPIR
jgi:hypothetical protein